MEPGVDREFAYRPRWWFVYVMTAGLVAYGAMLALGLVSALGEWSRQHGGTTAYGAFAQPLLALLLVVSTICIIWQQFAKARCGLVSVTSAGIIVRNGRGREACLLWPDVQELRVMPCLRLDTLDIRGSGQRLKVEFGIRDWGALRDLIIAQAGLTEVTHKWWGTLCARPSS
jgi:hypothetical protein